MSKNTWIVGKWEDIEIPESMCSLVIADPVYATPMVSKLWAALSHIPIACFMYAEDLASLDPSPDQILHWVKPVSTKNTARRYSRFVEVIAVRGVHMNTENLHWSNRTGVFTDHLISSGGHPWKKPESLIEKLIKNHYVSGTIFDPCAGSGTVHDVCKRLGIDSVSVEVDPQWART